MKAKKSLMLAVFVLGFIHSVNGMENNDNKHMAEAISCSVTSVKNAGGPFGAAIVKDGKVIACESNSVTKTNDPTAHAEVNAIRAACTALNTFDLSGCTIYTSCEPCPMCLGAIYWARLDRIFYGNTRVDAKNIGFDDSFIYDELEKSVQDRSIPVVQMMRDEAQEAFKAWTKKTDKTEY